jgi:hypothetical protein
MGAKSGQPSALAAATIATPRWRMPNDPGFNSQKTAKCGPI